MSKFGTARRREHLSTGFVGAAICWIAGIAICSVSVLITPGGRLPVRLIGLSGIIAGAAVCGWARSASPQWKLRLSAIFITGTVAIVLLEGGLRLYGIEPRHSGPSVIDDLELGFVLDPEHPDIDEYGFRNPASPDSIEIVAIGDHHTEGRNVSPDRSWPGHLSRLLEKDVYNMGVSGYGPRQYGKLIQRAIEMRPESIIVALHTADDLADAAQAQKPETPTANHRFSLRNFLQRNSASARLISEMIRHSRFGRPDGFEISHPSNPAYVASSRLADSAANLDITDPRILAGVNATLSTFNRASAECRRRNINFSVAFVPTRELVYSENLKGRQLEIAGGLKVLAGRETEITNRLQRTMNSQGITTVNLLPAMSAALDASKNLYSAHSDGRPLEAGYATYAATIAQAVMYRTDNTN